MTESIDPVAGRSRATLRPRPRPPPPPSDGARSQRPAERRAEGGAQTFTGKVVEKDLKDHRTIVAGNWSSYRRTYLHEHYHWKTEWQGEVKKFVIKAEDEIAKLSSAAASEADAKAELEPKATKIFNDQMKAARAACTAKVIRSPRSRLRLVRHWKRSNAPRVVAVRGIFIEEREAFPGAVKAG
jgi:hypothetical protein